MIVAVDCVDRSETSIEQWVFAKKGLLIENLDFPQFSQGPFLDKVSIHIILDSADFINPFVNKKLRGCPRNRDSLSPQGGGELWNPLLGEDGPPIFGCLAYSGCK